MNITIKKLPPPPVFTPIDVVIRVDTERELYALTGIASCASSVPSAVAANGAFIGTGKYGRADVEAVCAKLGAALYPIT